MMFKTKPLLLAGVALALLATGGCTRIRAHQGYIADPTLITGIQPGVDNRESVEATLGRPSFVGQFDQADWYYVARDTEQFAFYQPKASAQSVLKVRFTPAGTVASVQTTGLEQIVDVSPMGDKTPTLGRERGFFEELFGNIGAVGTGAGPGGGGGQPQ